MKIVIKPFSLLTDWSFAVEALVPSIKQLTTLFAVVLLVSFLKIYQCYWRQQHVAQHAHLQNQRQHVLAYHKALLLEHSTLLGRSQVLAAGRRHLDLHLPKHVMHLQYEAG